MVLHPATGEMVEAPRYGGAITFARNNEPAGPDVVIHGPWAQAYVAGVLEKVAIIGLATPNFWLGIMVMIYPAI